MPRRIDITLLFALCVLEGSLLLFAKAVHRLGDRAIFESLRTVPGMMGIAAVVLGLLAVGIIVSRYRRHRSAASRSFAATCWLNVVLVAITAAVGELSLRVLSTRTGDVAVFRGTHLLPRSWSDAAAHNNAILEQGRRQESYLVHDDQLGWQPGRSRSVEGGLYCSSVEGVRSAQAGVTLLSGDATSGGAGGTRETRHRIALIGDSYTFCKDVPFEESWGHQLAVALGDGFDVVNFGVSGYGVDQAYLRYRRDVMPWKPRYVIFGPTSHAYVRTLTVYAFIKFPHWYLPFSKPRFRLSGGELDVFNVPLPAPHAVFSMKQITELPFVEYDEGYRADDWERRFYHGSYLVRFARSVLPPPRAAPDLGETSSMESLNRAILREFVLRARQDGAIPILAHMPSGPEILRLQNQPRDDWSYSEPILRDAAATAEGAVFTDLQDDLIELERSQLLAPRGNRVHYAAPANRAVAVHFRELIGELVARPR